MEEVGASWRKQRGTAAWCGSSVPPSTWHLQIPSIPPACRAPPTPANIVIKRPPPYDFSISPMFFGLSWFPTLFGVACSLPVFFHGSLPGLPTGFPRLHCLENRLLHFRRSLKCKSWLLDFLDQFLVLTTSPSRVESISRLF